MHMLFITKDLIVLFVFLVLDTYALIIILYLWGNKIEMYESRIITII